MDRTVKKWIESKYNCLQGRKRRSSFIFVTLNLILFLSIATMIILNIWAIRKNPFNDTKIYFILLSITGTITGLLSSFLSFFKFKKNIKIYTNREEMICEQVELHKAKENEYSNKNRDSILIDNVLKIMENL